MKAIEQFCEKLDEMQCKYDRGTFDNGKEYVSIRSGAANFQSLAVQCIFDKDDTGAHIVCYEVCKFPEDKNLVMLQTANMLNMNYRWVKFYVTEDKRVVAEMDIIYTAENAGSAVLNAVSSVFSIMDSSYPVLMKALYA